jgi:hypothetical protein
VTFAFNPNFTSWELHRVASVGVRDLSLTVADRALGGINFAAWLHGLLHDLVARSIAGRADMLFDLWTSHAARPSQDRKSAFGL